MATYKLTSETKKSVMQIVAGENVPDEVRFIKYGGVLFKRSEVVLPSTGAPDPYEWIEITRDDVVGDSDLVVNGKDLIATTRRLKTSAQQRGLNVREEDNSGDVIEELSSQNAELLARIAELEAAAAPAQE